MCEHFCFHALRASLPRSVVVTQVTRDFSSKLRRYPHRRYLENATVESRIVSNFHIVESMLLSAGCTGLRLFELVLHTFCEYQNLTTVCKKMWCSLTADTPCSAIDQRSLMFIPVGSKSPYQRSKKRAAFLGQKHHQHWRCFECVEWRRYRQ